MPAWHSSHIGPRIETLIETSSHPPGTVHSALELIIKSMFSIVFYHWRVSVYFLYIFSLKMFRVSVIRSYEIPVRWWSFGMGDTAKGIVLSASHSASGPLLTMLPPPVSLPGAQCICSVQNCFRKAHFSSSLNGAIRFLDVLIIWNPEKFMMKDDSVHPSGCREQEL